MSSHLRRYRRGQRIAAGAVLASSALFAPYLLALRPMVSYASQRADRSQLSPRAIVTPCALDSANYSGGVVTVTNDSELQAAVVGSATDKAICVAHTDDSITLSQTLQIDDTEITLVGADDTAVLFANSSRHIDKSSHGRTLTVTNLTLDGGGAGGGIYSSANVVLRDDTFAGNVSAGVGYKGGALFIDGASLSIFGATFVDNRAHTAGGAIYVTHTAGPETTFIQNSSFEGNSVDGSNCQGGALFIKESRPGYPVTILGSSFEGNFVDAGCGGTGFGGGAIATHSEVSLLIGDSTHFDGNSNQLPSGRGGQGGGAILMDDTATLTIDGATFTDDSTVAGPGGAIAIGYWSTVTLTDAHFTNNRSGSGSGGAIRQRKFGSLAIYDSSFTGNHATFGTPTGGAVYSGSPLSVANSLFLDNYTSGWSAANGGAVFATGGLEVANSTFRGNVTQKGGGAVYAYSVDDTVVIEGSLFVGNEAGYGGSVYLVNDASSYPLGAFAISNSTFRDDSAVAGGSLMTYGWQAAAVPVTLNGVTISRSRANGNEGGAIYALYTDLSVTNSTFANNYSSQNGGAISGDDTTSITIDFSTITDNSTGANYGAGITLNNSAPTLMVRNSVVARNLAGAGYGNDIDVASPTAVTLESSFFTSDDTTSIYVPIGTTRSNLLFGDPLLGDLGNNGGSYVGATGDDTFIPTQLPAAGSPLIGAGLLNLIPAVTVDQLGTSRVQSAFPNQTTIGALFRALPNPTPPTPSNPPSAPREVTATGGDASATVTWTAPASSGSFPITNYRATAAPGGKTCLVVAPATTCRVEKLTNGTTYTFTVAALNGAGWGAESGPSNAVTPEAPTPPVEKTIVITGTRGTGNDNRTIYVAGTTTGLTGTVEPHYRFPGGQYTVGSARPAITDDGTFTWQRRSGKKTYVFFTHGDVKSNRVIIAAR